MSQEVLWRRGTSAQHATFIGGNGEITVDTTLNNLRVHDGVTPGGHIAGQGGITSWDTILNKPATFPPSTHTHTSAQISGLWTVETGKAGTRQFASVPVTTAADAQWRSLYIIQVNDVRQGDVIDIHGTGQVTTDLAFPVEFIHCIETRTWIQTDPVTGIVYSGGAEPLEDGSTVSILHSPISGHNISRDREHHQDFHRTWQFTAPQAFPVLYLALRVRFRSESATSGSAVSVDDGQGAIWYTRFNRR